MDCDRTSTVIDRDIPIRRRISASSRFTTRVGESNADREWRSNGQLRFFISCPIETLHRPLPRLPPVDDQAEEEEAQKQRSGPRLGNSAHWHCLATLRINGHDIRIHRHGAVARQGSAAPDICAGDQGDACERENISFERSGRAESRRAPDLPKNAVALAAIGKNNRRAACARQRAPDLEKEDCIRVALGVERECPGQLCR